MYFLSNISLSSPDLICHSASFRGDILTGRLGNKAAFNLSRKWDSINLYIYNCKMKENHS